MVGVALRVLHTGGRLTLRRRRRRALSPVSAERWREQAASAAFSMSVCELLAAVLAAALSEEKERMNHTHTPIRARVCARHSPLRVSSSLPSLILPTHTFIVR